MTFLPSFFVKPDARNIERGIRLGFMVIADAQIELGEEN
jgi:hypothetical protein